MGYGRRAAPINWPDGPFSEGPSGLSGSGRCGGKVGKRAGLMYPGDCSPGRLTPAAAAAATAAASIAAVVVAVRFAAVEAGGHAGQGIGDSLQNVLSVLTAVQIGITGAVVNGHGHIHVAGIGAYCLNFDVGIAGVAAAGIAAAATGIAGIAATAAAAGITVVIAVTAHSFTLFPSRSGLTPSAGRRLLYHMSRGGIG